MRISDWSSDVCSSDLFAAFADFLVVNVSSPNTPGLRGLQGGRALSALLDRVGEAFADLTVPQPPALLVKVAPDLDEAGIAEIAAVVLERKGQDGKPLVQGMVVGNTTTGRPPELRSRHRAETGR